MKTLTDFEFAELATAVDSYRELLCGVLGTGNALVATDTHRLHVTEYPNQPELDEKQYQFTATSTNTACRKKVASFRPDWETQRYPDWKRVVPADWKDNELNHVVSFEVPDELLEFLKKIVSLSKEYTGHRLTVDTDVTSQTMTCKLVNHNLSSTPSVSFQVNCKVDDDFKFAVNMNYLFDAIRGVITRTTKPVVELRFNKDCFNYNQEYTRPIIVCEPIVESDSYLRYAVVMPMTYSG